ncbi:hypothetical protein HU200_021335 [Digitaria exilis]|uniref:Uncharacterized protein n=1 Tax=Digitaria exilis TaxID=1010633 RepID=A0A835F083_9POAL|nr:hypothetical protein HU200_021335 [Digitaria exilis]
MNTSSRLWPHRDEPHGCDGDGCASDLNTWPLHHAPRRGERCRLCTSCILLSQRSLYCCCCFLIITSPSSDYDHDDPLMGPPSPTVTCHICREAIVHLGCLYPAAEGGVFVCPACLAAEEGRLFTYAPPCREPLDERGARIILLGARMALALLNRDAAAARAEAERKARVAVEARGKAYRALSVAYDLDKQDRPAPPPGEGTTGKSIVVDTPPQRPKDHLVPSEEGISEAIVEDTLLVHRYGMPPPPMAALAIGRGCATAAAAAAMAHADGAESSQSTPPWPWSEATTMATAGCSMANASPPRTTLKLFGVQEMAMVAAEAVRTISPPALRTLELFPAKKAGASGSKMPRTLQLFEDDDEEM